VRASGFAMHQDIGNSSASGHRRQLCVTPLQGMLHPQRLWSIQ